MHTTAQYGWISFATLAAAAILILIPTSSPAQWKTPWEYEGPKGPEHWSDPDPAYAACNGKEQSPIDIQSAEKAPTPGTTLRFQNRPAQISG